MEAYLNPTILIAFLIMQVLYITKQCYQRIKKKEKDYSYNQFHFIKKLINEFDIVNGYIYYNIANCYYNTGDLGEAILYYRLAERLIPTDENLNNNLQLALDKRKDKIDKEQIDSILRSIFFWHYIISPYAKMWWFSVFFILIWISLLIYVFYRKPFIKYITVFSIIISFIFSLSIVFHLIDDETTEIGVITKETADAKNGPGINYPNTFKNKLHEGTEFEVLDHQLDWYQVKLPNGKICWFSNEDVEIAKLRLFSF